MTASLPFSSSSPAFSGPRLSESLLPAQAGGALSFLSCFIFFFGICNSMQFVWVKKSTFLRKQSKRRRKDCMNFSPAYSPPPPHTLGAEVFFMESLTPFIRHELEDAPGPSGPPEETSSMVSPPLGAEPGQPPVTEPPKPGRGSQQPPSQPDGPDVQLPPPEVPQPRPDCGIQHPGQVVLHTTSQSASQTAPLVGEPLAKR